jgi:hypothetical protein
MRRIRNSGKFEIIFHIRTENIVREYQGPSRPERTSDWTEARRGDGAEAWKSKTGSLDSAAKLNRKVIGINCNLGQ